MLFCVHNICGSPNVSTSSDNVIRQIRQLCIEFYTYLILVIIAARAMLCVVYAMALCLCVSMSVSVKSRSCTKTAKRRMMQSVPHDCPGTLVF